MSAPPDATPEGDVAAAPALSQISRSELTSLVEDLGAVMAPPVGASGALAKRWRLAGVVLGARAADSLAILDDRELVRQSVVAPGEMVADGVRLVSVDAGAATLESGGVEETLVLQRVSSSGDSPTPGGGKAPAPASVSSPARSPRERAAESFGGREVFPGRWAYDRDKVMDYYEELRAQPERLLSIFDTMDPVWGENDDGSRRIDGYRVAVKGEPEFFQAAGLQEGDVVVAVNSAPMDDRRRAEALISSFIRGDASTFVFEIDRGGQRVRQVVEIE